MGLISQPYTFSPNTTIYSAQVDANFTTLFNWANGGVDHGNVGSVGFWASDLKPVGAGAATFGGSTQYAFPNGILLQGAVSGNAPLTVQATSGGSATLAAFLGSGFTGVITIDANLQTVFTPAGAGFVPVAIAGIASPTVDQFTVGFGGTKWFSIDKNGAMNAFTPPIFSDTTDNTKKATFAMSSITTATTRTYTFPNVSGTFITSGDTGTVTNAMLAGSIAQSNLAAFAGVNVGGALTNATTGAFSSSVTETASIFTGAAAPAGTNVYVANDNAATNGLRLNVPTGSTNGFLFAVNGTTRASISNAGLGTFVGVNAGGAISGATNGAFSSTLTAQEFVATGFTASPSSGQVAFGTDSNNAIFRLNPSTSGAYQFQNSGGTAVWASIGSASSAFLGAVTPGNGTSVGTSGVYSGTGVPAFSAPNGSLFMRFDSTTVLYVNTSGASTSGTTWTAVTIP